MNPRLLSAASQNRHRTWVDHFDPALDATWRRMYHFTSMSVLPAILQSGIAKGDVPITPQGGFNAPWFTLDPAWECQGWATGSVLDKSEVRIAVDLPVCPLLRHWPELANAEHMDPTWYHMLNYMGSPEKRVLGNPDNWYVFMGRVSPKWIHEVDYRDNPKGHWGTGKTSQPE